jgi:hypothetical protein
VLLGEQAATRPGQSRLTGSWRGRYEYSDTRPGVDFELNMTVSQGKITGFVSEPNTFGDKTSKNLYANLVGQISGNAIGWTKRYDGTGGQSHAVEYRGTLDRKARRIVGRWTIGAASGAFQMSLD